MATASAPEQPRATVQAGEATAAARLLETHYVFTTGGLRFAVPLSGVHRLAAVDELTPVPLAPAHLAGIAQVQDEVVACLDLGRLAGREAAPGSGLAVVVEFADLRAGLLAAGVGRTLDIDPGRVVPPRWSLPERPSRMVRGWVELDDGGALVLDLPALLAGLAPRWELRRSGGG